MLISAVCPVCGTRYQVEDTLRGKVMRCPRADCRTVFPIGGEVPPSAAPRSVSGGVGDMVPILTAEAAPTEAPAEASWQDAPPVRGTETEAVVPAAPPVRPAPPPRKRRPPSEILKTAPAVPALSPTPPATTPAEPQAPEAPTPVEMPPGAWEAPPVRRPGEPSATVAPPEPVAAAPVKKPLVSTGPAASRWAKRIVLLLGLVVLVGAGVGVYLFVTAVHDTEERLAGAADEAYKQGRWSDAAALYQKSQERFPQSPRLAEYVFLQRFADLQAKIAEQKADPGTALKLLQDFVAAHADDPNLKPHAADLGKLLAGIVAPFAKENETASGAAPRVIVKQAKEVRDAVAQVDGALSEEQDKAVAADLARVETAVGLWERRQDILAQLTHPPPGLDSIHLIHRAQAIRQREGNLNGPEAAEADRIIEGLFVQHLKAVQFQFGPGPKAPDLPSTDASAALWFVDPPTEAVPAGADDDLTFALCRGVLYALNQWDGQVRWVIRVGVDAPFAPIRLPPEAKARYLLAADDARTLVFLSATGKREESLRLAEPCSAPPLLDGLRAFVPTRKGDVYEIDLVKGEVTGRFPLGQRLTHGGVRDAAGLLYFAADEGCVYVLDANPQKPQCRLILYTNHSAGSLRCAPVLVGALGPESPQYLLLCRADGLRATTLRLYPLPLSGRDATEVVDRRTSKPLGLRLPGWNESAPLSDGETLALLTDAGQLGLFGIDQPGDEDTPLFRLQEDLTQRRKVARTEPQRGQVVRLQGRALTVLADGELQRWRGVWRSAGGPDFVPAWSGLSKDARHELELGLPLAPATVVENRRSGRTELYLVTQPLTRSTGLATAVNDATGAILWKSRLGLFPHGDPVVLAPLANTTSAALSGLGLGAGVVLGLGTASDGASTLLTVDAEGVVYAFDAARPQPEPGLWPAKVKRLTESVPDLAAPPLLLPTPDGRLVYLALRRKTKPGPASGGETLVLSRLSRDVEGRPVAVQTQTAPLDTALAGTPVLTENGQILLYAVGANLYRLRLNVKNDIPLRGEATWRGASAGPDAVARLTPLGADLLLTNDGSGTVRCVQLKEDGSIGGKVGELTLPDRHRLVVAPLVLSATPMNQRVLLADEAGGLFVYASTDGGQTWRSVGSRLELGGRITDGPFPMPGGATPRAAFVVEGRRLVVVEPLRPAAKALSFEADADFVGTPHAFDKGLLVADQSGRILVLEEKDNALRPRGSSQRTPPGTAAATAPLPFGPQRLFVPLSDGTVLLLPHGGG